MEVVFNIVIIGLVLLIGYWWANQGLFSAILHLICVVAAGAIALAIWEPLVTGVLLRNSFFDNYAWGLGLVGPFALLLLIFRLIFDKTIGANVTLPRWADLTFGLAVGVAAGILTAGIFVIGAGYIHAGVKIMGFTGYARSGRSAEVAQLQTMWVPVHRLTADFYSYLSVGSLRPDISNKPLRHYYPDIDRVAVSLHRDSFDKGRGKTTLAGKDARITRVLACDSCNPRKLSVEVEFEPGARDFGEVLTLSASQVRLIGSASGFSEARVAYPIAFSQYSGFHRFDDISHYVSSEPAQQRAKAILEFNVNDLNGQTPRFIQIKGTRFRLPAPGSADWEVMESSAYRTALGSTTGPMDTVDIAPNGIDITAAMKQGNDIRPIQVSINQLPANVETSTISDKYYIRQSDAEFLTTNPNRPGRGLEIAGIVQPPGTTLVKVDVSRSSSASIYKDMLMNLAGTDNPTVMLVDDKGRPYLPLGYMWQQPNGRTRIKVDFESATARLSDLPQLPTSDTHKLTLIFQVTNGSTIKGMKLGEAVVGTCNVLVEDPDKLKAQENQGNQNFGAESAGG